MSLRIINTMKLINYNARMDSTGFFLAAFHTGIKVATTAVAKAIANNTIHDNGPNTNSDASIKSTRIPLIALHTATLPMIEIARHTAVMTKDSEKKILNTSILLAPTARRIPISRFLYEIEMAIKLDNSNAANIANTRRA